MLFLKCLMYSSFPVVNLFCLNLPASLILSSSSLMSSLVLSSVSVPLVVSLLSRAEYCSVFVASLSTYPSLSIYPCMPCFDALSSTSLISIHLSYLSLSLQTYPSFTLPDTLFCSPAHSLSLPSCNPLSPLSFSLQLHT